MPSWSDGRCANHLMHLFGKGPARGGVRGMKAASEKPPQLLNAMVRQLRDAGSHIGPKSVSVQVFLLCKWKYPDLAYGIYREGKAENMRTTCETFDSLLRGYASMGNHDRFTEILQDRGVAGFSLSPHTANAQLTLFRHTGDTSAARGMWESGEASTFIRPGSPHPHPLWELSPLARHTVHLAVRGCGCAAYALRRVVRTDSVISEVASVLRSSVGRGGCDATAEIQQHIHSGEALLEYLQGAEHVVMAYALLICEGVSSSSGGEATADPTAQLRWIRGEMQRLQAEVQVLFDRCCRVADVVQRGGGGLPHQQLLLGGAAQALSNLRVAWGVAPGKTLRIAISDAAHAPRASPRRVDADSTSRFLAVPPVRYYAAVSAAALSAGDFKMCWEAVRDLLSICTTAPSARQVPESLLESLLAACRACWEDAPSDLFVEAAWHANTLFPDRGAACWRRQEALMGFLAVASPRRANEYMVLLRRAYSPQQVPHSILQTFLAAPV